LDEDIAQIEVNSGAVSVHLRELEKGDTFEIDTPNATVRLMEPGDYRVDVDAGGASTLSVRSGDAQIDSGSGPVNVHDQQQARLSADDRYADVTMLGTPDAFDDWSMERERYLQDSEAERYVSREVVGYEDLDRYGEWYSEPEYGEVWSPSVVSVGWAPYTYGRWLWVGSWGWTWVDNSPWGFAPFHYGRWTYLRNRWCWVPGPRHHRPIYAPALVGWTNPHGYSRHQRPDGWVPLGPREVYVPGRHVSPRYLRNVNIGNTHIDDNTRITNSYRNRGRNFDYVNRNAPGLRPENNGLPRNGLAGSNDGDNRWRSGPGWRTGTNPGRIVSGDNNGRNGNGDDAQPGASPGSDNRNDNHRDWHTGSNNGRDWHNGSGPRDDAQPGSGAGDDNRNDNNRDWRAGSNNGRDWRNGSGRSDNAQPGVGTGGGDNRDGRGVGDNTNGWRAGDNNGVWRFRRNNNGQQGDNRSSDNASGDGHMTIPRNPSDRMQAESQRDRLRREAAAAASGYDRRLSSPADRSDREQSWQRQRDDNARRESRPWSNGSPYRVPDRSPQPSSGGERRSYGGLPTGQSRPMPSPRVEQRPVQSQPARPQPSSGNRGGDSSSRAGGRFEQRR
jgi:hypothetical protein